jgi:Kef-type K+ transport system membrane component KefB
LGFLLFLAGVEIDLHRFGAKGIREAFVALAISLSLGIAAGYILFSLGLTSNAFVVGIALTATSSGLVVSILKDAKATTKKVGTIVLAGSASAELTAVVLLSVLFARHGGPIGGRLLLLGALVATLTVVTLSLIRVDRWPRTIQLLNSQGDTTAQLRVRLAVAAVVGLSFVAERLGFEAILGAFLAGVMLRIIDPNSKRDHPQFQIKLNGIGYGFLIPIFFIVSGVTFDVHALTSQPTTLLRVPLFFALLVVVRSVPVFVYRGELGKRELVSAGLLLSTSLPMLVVAAQIGVSLQMVTKENAAALVAAGLLSVIICPALAVRLLRAKELVH